jgi:hypothetical protein
MDDLLYREEILDHYYSSPHRGRLESPDLLAELDNPLCGDHIRLELRLGPGDRIERVRFDGDGCAISQVRRRCSPATSKARAWMRRGGSPSRRCCDCSGSR